MARFPKDIHFSGTVDILTFYQKGGKTFSRMKSSLTRKRVLKDKAFASTRQYASHFARAAKIASLIYKELPTDIRGRWIYRSINGEAASLLYKGKEEQEVKNLLYKKYITKTGCAGKDANKARSTKKVNEQFMKMFQAKWKKQGKPLMFFELAWEPGERFNPVTIPRRSEYFQGLRHAMRLKEVNGQ